jgi:hypothetical protein
LIHFLIPNRIREALRDVLYPFLRLPGCVLQRLICQLLTRLGPVISQNCTHIIFRTTRFTLTIARVSGKCDVLEIDGALRCDGTADHKLRNFIRSTMNEPRFKFVNFRDRGSQRWISVTYEPASSTTGTLVYRWATPSGDENTEIRMRCDVQDKYIEFTLERIITPPPGAYPHTIDHIWVANMQLSGLRASTRTGTVITGEACDPTGSATGYRISEFALTLPTNITVSQGHSSIDWDLAAGTDKLVALSDLSVAFFACAEADWLATAGEIERAYRLPQPLIEGAWAKNHADRFSSYLFVDIKPSNANYILERAQRGGFKYILIRVAAWAKTLGHYELRDDDFASLTTTVHDTPVDPLHPEGAKMKFGLHVLTGVISAGDSQFDPDDYYPVDPAHPLDHFEGSKYFPDIRESAGKVLLDEIAGNFAEVYSETSADMAYLDTVAGFSHFDPPLPPWYTYSLVVNAYWKKLVEVWRATRDVALTEPSALLHSAAGTQNYEWHALARATSGDYAVIGVEAYMDTVKLKLENRTEFEDAFLVQDLGWIGLLAKVGRTTRDSVEYSFLSTTVDEIEYQLNRSLGFGLPIGFETTEKNLRTNGFTDQILERIRLYERVRLAGLLSSDRLNLLRDLDPDLDSDPGREDRASNYEPYGLKKVDYELLETPGGYVLKPRAYFQHVFSASDPDWAFKNPFEDQPLNIKIQALPALADATVSSLRLIDRDIPDNDIYQPSGIVISRSNWDDTSKMLTLEIQNNPDGTEVRWVEVCEDFASPLDLCDHKYLGLEVQGPGNGEYVSIMLQNSNDTYRQYQFKVEPGPMRRKELFLPATGSLHQILQPDAHDRKSSEILKNSHRPFRYGEIKRVTIWIKNIQQPTSSETLTFRFRQVEALGQDYPALINPSVQVNGRAELQFQARLHPDGLHDEFEPEGNPGPWDYLAFDGTFYRVYNGNNKPAPDFPVVPPLVDPADCPRIRHGDNTVRYRHTGSSKAIITFIVEGLII